jgi:hypothetical protein
MHTLASAIPKSVLPSRDQEFRPSLCVECAMRYRQLGRTNL